MEKRAESRITCDKVTRMKKGLSSRERMLAAICNREADRVPFCFMIFSALRDRCKDRFEFVEKQLEMGLDATVELPMGPLEVQTDHNDLPGLPVRYHPQVRVKEWREDIPTETYPILHKEYHTPAGTLSTAVNKTDDWLYADRVPFFDDYLIPRSRKYLVENQNDLRALRYLLTPPTADDIRDFREKSKIAKQFAEKHDLLVVSPRGVGLEAACWLCGIKNLILQSIDNEEFVAELADLLHEWNRQRMEVFLDAGVHLLIRRGWYEGTDFWSPALFRKFVFPYLAKEIEMAHQAGAYFGYITTSGTMPLLDMLLELGLDVLIGVDPIQGKGTDMALMKEKLKGKIGIWGGVNGFVTVERGSKSEVKEAVDKAIEILAPGGGFILSPVDNARCCSGLRGATQRKPGRIFRR